MSELPRDDRAQALDEQSLTAQCGAPTGDAVLLGLEGRALVVQSLYGTERRVHRFDDDDPALAAGHVLKVWRAGDFVLVELAGSFDPEGSAPQTRVLLTRDGERHWARRWPAGAGAEVRFLGAQGDLLLESLAGYAHIDASGHEQPLEHGFTPFEPPDGEGFMPGVFNEGDRVTGYGFQRVRTSERRVLRRAERAAVGRTGPPQSDAGRFYYAFVDRDGVTWLTEEGHERERLFELGMHDALVELAVSATHVLVHVRGRPLFLLERFGGSLAPVAAGAVDSGRATDLVDLRVDGAYFVALRHASGEVLDERQPFSQPPPERLYRLHGPSGVLETVPVPELPVGRVPYAYALCSGAEYALLRDGRLLIPMVEVDAEEPPPVLVHVEAESGGFQPLGREVAFANGVQVWTAGGTSLLRTHDARAQYCAVRPSGDAGAGVLAGRTVQVIAPDGEVVAFEADATTGELERDIALSADGHCALIGGPDTGYTLRDLTTHEARAVTLENPRFLYAGDEPYASW
jgi:hypothetical protein